MTAEHICKHERCNVFNGMGSGKTASTIFACEFMRHQGEITGPILIVCPKSCVESVWADEIFKLNPGRRVVPLIQPKPKQLEAAKGADYIIVNHDGLKLKRTYDLLAEIDLQMIVADEVTAFKGSKGKASQRYKALVELSDGIRFVGLTGTPTPQGPEDGFYLSKLVRNQDAPVTFMQWRIATAIQSYHNKHVWRPKPGWEARVATWLQPSVTFSTEECIDLPESVTLKRTAELTGAQTKMIKTIQDELHMEDANGVEITAANAAVAISKVLQICGGAVRATHEEEAVVVEVDAKPRYDLITEVINEANAKVVIFAPFTAALQGITDHLNKTFGDQYAALIDGSVAQSKRTAAFSSFQEDTAGVQAIVAHPKTAAHGLTLTAADTIIFAGPILSSEEYLQACARVRRPGQTKTSRIVQIGSHPIEWQIYKRLEERGTSQEELLGLCKEFLV